jgi:hypothetical protein
MITFYFLFFCPVIIWLERFINPRKASKISIGVYAIACSVFGWLWAKVIGLLLLNRITTPYLKTYPEAWIAIAVILCVVDGYTLILRRVVK